MEWKNEQTVVLESLYFWSDWTDFKKHTIDLKEIIGFRLDFRLKSWHVIVVTKKKIDEYNFETYELSHQVYPNTIKSMISEDKIKILNIKNYHNSDIFIEHLRKVIK